MPKKVCILSSEKSIQTPCQKAGKLFPVAMVIYQRCGQKLEGRKAVR